MVASAQELGIGYVGSAGSSDGGILTVPVMANNLFGKDGKYFEVGAGITYISGTVDLGDLDSKIIGTMSLMYRNQPVNGGFMWKIEFTPIFASGVFIPYYPGLAIGYSW